MSAVGVVFSNIHDSNIPELTRNRTMASVPVGGRYRLIDFVLSNMVNSDISTVGIITKSNYQSLMDHVGSGKDWDLARKSGGLILLPPFGAALNDQLYSTRLEALQGIIKFLERRTETYAVLSDSDAIGRVDYKKVIAAHEASDADFTLVYHDTETEGTIEKIIFTSDESGRIVDISPSNKVFEKASVFMNVMVVNRQFLIGLIRDSISHNLKSFHKDILMKNLKSLKIFGYRFDGYFAAIDSLRGYFKHNMELLNADVRQEVFGRRDIYTKVRDSAPTKYGASSQVNNSLISDGCTVEGEVENSILFRGVHVGRGTVIRNSILMQDTMTGENVSLNCIITDKNVVIRDKISLSGCDSMPFFIPKGNMCKSITHLTTL